jgi:hypothetical protein
MDRVGAQLEETGKTIWLVIGYVALFLAVCAIPAIIAALVTHNWMIVPNALWYMVQYVFGFRYN